MKLIPFFFLTALPLSAATVAQWNFNSSPADGVNSTGSSLPSTGTGILSTIGGATNPSFNSGAGSSDVATDNTGFQTTTFPALSTANKTAGLEVRTSTVGYDSIIVSWDQRHSNTSANTTRLQYTLDASATTPVWVDNAQFTFTPAATGTGDIWYNARTANLTSISGVANNANFAFRVVAEFDPNTSNYLASRSTSSYGTAGTWRFDMVTVSGVAVVPEPSAMLLGSLGMLGLLRRRR